MDERLLKVFKNMTEDFINALKDELAKPRIHSPGFNSQAYSEGRDGRFKVSKPTSPFGSTLNESIEAKKTDDGYFIEMADHWENVVTGMKPQPQFLTGKGSGTSKLLPALAKWARSRGISNPEQAAFGIRRNIWKYGIQPFNFIASAEDAVLDTLETELDEELFEVIEDIFDEVIQTQTRQF